jgi:hypothetical protein
MSAETPTLLAANLDLLTQSLVRQENAEYGLTRAADGLRLVVAAGQGHPALNSFVGERSEVNGQTLIVAPLSAANAAALRLHLPWLQPRGLGPGTSAGLGDRLGLATPGHVRAMKKAGGGIAPIFAQQSIRENARTGRTPQQVLDEATWGVFQENWQAGFGADADHLKTTGDIDSCLAAGYTFFTIDPGEYVDSRAESASLGELRELASALPDVLRPEASGLLGKSLQVEHLSLTFDEHTALKAAVKYGRAVWHVASMYRHLSARAGAHPFELEVSVDETEQPTSHAEHAYIASELKRLGVRWISLAPRYIGAFEKGVDYIGDLTNFEADIAGHAAIARHFGPYKLSLHSGSDKFSIYPAAVRQTRGLVHLKTAGTSYLEALRTIAAVDPGLFGEIYAFARQRYETDRISYHVSAQLARAPLPEQVGDPTVLLDQFDARQILHVTFGSVLTARADDGSPLFADRLMSLLREHSSAYAANLEAHFIRHLTPFARR